ncbi:MAG: hypothetical protein DRQ62_01550 [Gammaproteobacteria bacterium]|nr:MAG: hypothetical protein DRQ62_01550 [Gammaproteobacteria bacterium]
MADDKDKELNDDGTPKTPKTPEVKPVVPPKDETDEDKLKRLVQESVDVQLKPIKDKLDGAYEARDGALKESAELKQKESDRQKESLKAEGKHEEAHKLEMAEQKAANDALTKRNVELTRDIDVRNAINAHTFRNEKAVEMAYQDVVKDLVQADNGSWVHKNGTSIKDTVAAFVANEENSFLLKPKHNSGPGHTPPKDTDTSDKSKSLFEMSQDEVLKLAMAKKLPNQQPK